MNSEIFDQICKSARQDVLRTVGYNESLNKAEFEKGMDIYINKITERAQSELELSSRTLKINEQHIEALTNDLRTLNYIINKYGGNQ